MPEYAFDRFLRYDELTAWLQALAAEHPDLVTVESYGRSHEGRDLWLVTVTDASTGGHDTKPAHWVDASIHAVELTATVAACRLLHHLVDGHAVVGLQRSRLAPSHRAVVVLQADHRQLTGCNHPGGGHERLAQGNRQT